MASNYDPTDFVDDDFQTRAATTMTGAAQRAPTREEVDSRVGEAQQKLAEMESEIERLQRLRRTLRKMVKECDGQCLQSQKSDVTRKNGRLH